MVIEKMSKPKKHNRKGPKSTRGGCLLCKPYKRQGTPLKDRQKHSITVRIYAPPEDDLDDLEKELSAWLKLSEQSLHNAWGDEDDMWEHIINNLPEKEFRRLHLNAWDNEHEI